MKEEINKTIFRDFFENKLQGDGRKKVLRWLLDAQNDSQVRNWMEEDWELICQSDVRGQLNTEEENSMWQSIQAKLGLPAPMVEDSAESTILQHTGVFSLYKWISVAAAILLVLGVGLYYFSNQQTPKVNVVVSTEVQPPDHNKAILVLADGKKLNLNSTAAGNIADQAGSEIIKTESDKLVYAATGQTGSATAEVQYNTLMLPRGSKPMSLQLADGSRVWLNAGSTLTFPTAFVKGSRTVKLSGEAYFEVAHDESRPFYVNNNGFTVKVLGTKFNVNSYAEEPHASVTLVDGLVNVETPGKVDRLRPGQQLKVTHAGTSLDRNVNLEEVLSWKNNEFYFDGRSLRDIMNEVERFYGVQAEFKDEIPYSFVARISRDVPLSKLLEKMELTDLAHFEIKGNTIIIRK